MGVQNEWMYKPIPFFLSSRGYAVFVHTSAPVTFDFGKTYDGHNVVYNGDEQLDLFVFLGDPKDVLSEYTQLTGRSPVPPLWSFGFWMSRITYKSEDEVRAVAASYASSASFRRLHLDTGGSRPSARRLPLLCDALPRPGADDRDLKRQGSA